MVFNLQQCPLRKNITLQATQPCRQHAREKPRSTQYSYSCWACITGASLWIMLNTQHVVPRSDRMGRALGGSYTCDLATCGA